ncbi:MAG: ABC transporter ATP-binding protein [Armatimonadetes bacterium]|nr:ABC transporter ATP-binding protein [Armatimonadota bacterium]
MINASRDLRFTEVAKIYKTSQAEVTILDGVSLSVMPGETVAIVGPSGSGKSTLLNIAGSLDKPTSGSVRIGDIEINKLEGKSLAEFRANQVGFIFQDHHLLPQLTALENVLLPTIASANKKPSILSDKPSILSDKPSILSDKPSILSDKPSILSDKPSILSSVEGRGQITAKAQALLERVGILPRADAFPAQMSGGERQRVAIARALINGAKLLLCDEPTGNLDWQAGRNIIDLLLELAAEQGATVIMVTHNHAHAARFSKIFMISDGTLIPVNTSSEAGGAH